MLTPKQLTWAMKFSDETDNRPHRPAGFGAQLQLAFHGPLARDLADEGHTPTSGQASMNVFVTIGPEKYRAEIPGPINGLKCLGQSHVA